MITKKKSNTSRNKSKSHKYKLLSGKDDENIHIDKFLSEGVYGKVYLITKNNRKYAMKIEYILSRDDTFFKYELDFVKRVASKYPECRNANHHIIF